MSIRSLACRSPGQCAGDSGEDVQRIEAVRRVGYHQGYAGVPRLIASHWSELLRLAYLSGFHCGRTDRRREPAPLASRKAQ